MMPMTFPLGSIMGNFVVTYQSLAWLAGEQRLNTVNEWFACAHDPLVVLANFTGDPRWVNVCIRQPEDVVFLQQTDTFQNAGLDATNLPCSSFAKKCTSGK